MNLDLSFSNPYFGVLVGTGITFLGTILGAATVYFFKNGLSKNIQVIFPGFASGVMIAASVWSLLIPGIEMAENQGQSGWLVAAGGFALGGVFLLLLDHLIPHFHYVENVEEGPKSSLKRTTMLILAVTLHNIPEGMSVGLAFAVAAKGDAGMSMAAAFSLAIGMALQNFPEGAAISLPLKQEGFSRNKAFLWGAMSGIVEPIGGFLTVLLVGKITPVLPWLLAFAAGAMIYVVVEELIPEMHRDTHSNLGTMAVMVGFIVMMVLDIALS